MDLFTYVNFKVIFYKPKFSAKGFFVFVCMRGGAKTIQKIDQFISSTFFD